MRLFNELSKLFFEKRIGNKENAVFCNQALHNTAFKCEFTKRF